MLLHGKAEPFGHSLNGEGAEFFYIESFHELFYFSPQRTRSSTKFYISILVIQRSLGDEGSRVHPLVFIITLCYQDVSLESGQQKNTRKIENSVGLSVTLW